MDKLYKEIKTEADQEYIAELVNEIYRQAAINTIDKHFKNGDKVRINIRQITNRKSFERTSSKYRGLLASVTEEEIFTVKSTSDIFVELEEIPVWLWYIDDLILV